MVQGAGCEVQGSGCRVQGVGSKVQGEGSKKQSEGCKVTQKMPSSPPLDTAEGVWKNSAALNPKP